MSDASFEPTGRNVTGQKLTLPGRKLTPDRSECDPNNKYNNKDDNNTNIHTLIKECYKGNSITPEGEEILRN